MQSAESPRGLRETRPLSVTLPHGAWRLSVSCQLHGRPVTLTAERERVTGEPWAWLEIRVVICKPPVHTGTHVYIASVCIVFHPVSPTREPSWFSKRHAETVAVPFLRTKKKKKSMCHVIALYCESIFVACCAQNSLDSELTASTKELNVHRVATVLCLG